MIAASTMDRSKSRLVYGLCLIAPALAGGRPDGRDDGEVHANLPFTLSASATPAVSAAAASPAKNTFSAIATMSHNTAPAMSSSEAAAASSVVVLPASLSSANGESAPNHPKATPVKYTGQPSILEISSSATGGAAASLNSGKTPATTPAPSSAAAASKTTPYIDDWRTRMTWPPGCEEWANPCPQGVPLIGGGTARTLSNNYVPVGSQSGYVNPFTSFLTMTDANGVVTGMPPKATVPAGMGPSSSASASTIVVVPGSKAGASGASTAAAPLPKQSAGGNGTSSSPKVSHNGASTMQAAGVALFAGILGLFAVMI